MTQITDIRSTLRRIHKAASEWKKKTNARPPAQIIEPAIHMGIVDVKTLAKIGGVDPKDLQKAFCRSGNKDATRVIAEIAKCAQTALAKLEAGEQSAKSVQTAKGQNKGHKPRR